MAAILVIDDDEQMRRLIRRILDKLGHVVYEAASGRVGLEVFHRVRPDLVVSDIVMPDGEGIETIRKLHAEAPSMPILAISGGSANALYLRAATSLGAGASLAKPFRPQELGDLVAELLAAVE